jgi:ATP-dependent Clp protease adaptor protein ClpS
MPDSPRYDVLLLNDNDTPMEFVVIVLERFFGIPYGVAVAHMYRIHNTGKAICGTYSREEAENKVADVLAFAAEHKHPLQCILRQED